MFTIIFFSYEEKQTDRIVYVEELSH